MTTNFLIEEEGHLLLKIAKNNIKSYLDDEVYYPPKDLPDIFNDKLGVFVTLTIDGNLRGCIGYPEPYMTLLEGLMDVSIAAAFEDPRFKPLTKEEFQNIDVEVSVLTKPEEVIVDNYEEYFEKLEVGRDGLIIEDTTHRGLLLPQVPVEQNWDLKTYLENLCYKAGLYANAWKEDFTRIYSFQAQIFEEK